MIKTFQKLLRSDLRIVGLFFNINIEDDYPEAVVGALRMVEDDLTYLAELMPIESHCMT